MFDNMTEEKLKKTVVGMVVAGTVLVVLLLCVMLYQFVSMGVKQAQINSLNAQIQEYEEKKAKLEEEYGIVLGDEYKEKLAFLWGYVHPDTKTPEDLFD